MKRIIMAISAVFLLVLALPKAGLALEIDMGDVRIGIALPPPVEFAGPPELLPIPGRYAYFVTDIDVDIFFYRGVWYRPFKGRWFRADSYRGRWEPVRDAPAALLDLPPDYRSSSSRYRRIPHGELGNNWERWERDKYWDRRRIEPPPLKITGQLELLPIPGRYVYFIPDINEDVFFYRGQWYRPYKGRWFMSDRYDGRWELVRDAPAALEDLDYRSSASRFDRIPYKELGRNWERWERDKYWDSRRIRERHGYRKGEEDPEDDMEDYREQRGRDRY